MSKVYSYIAMVNEDHVPYMAKDKEFNSQAGFCYNNPEDIADFMRQAGMGNFAEEYVYVMALDSKCHMIGISEVSHGTVHISIVSQREVFMRALMLGASQIVLIHNHPSGDPTPSKEDIEVTRNLKEAEKILGIPVVDHIIVCRNSYFSFSENKYNEKYKIS